MLKNIIHRTPLTKATAIALMTPLIFFGGCGGDDEANDYSGVGKLISDRNKARQRKADSQNQEMSDDALYDEEVDSPSTGSTGSSSGLIFEENVRIVSEKSGKTIAWATAYLDKGGRIVNIRIRKKR